MEKNRRNIQSIKIFEEERRRKYKEELDLLVRLKAKEKENRSNQNGLFQTVKNLELCKDLERKDHNLLRELQKNSCQQAMGDQAKHREMMENQEQENKRTYNRNLKESLCVQQVELEQKKEMRLREIEESRHQYEDYMFMKKHRARQVSQADKDFFVQETRFREKLERENRELMERVRRESRKYEDVLPVYANLNNEERRRKQMTDYKFIVKGFLEKEAKELERETRELERLKSVKNEITETLVQQMENNRIKKEFLRYENLRVENEILTEEMAVQKNQSDKTKLERQATIREMMGMLARQIREREERLLGSNNLTTAEEEINCRQKDNEGGVVGGEMTVGSIPGFCVQQDRLRMISVFDKDMKLTDYNLQEALMNQNRVNDKSVNKEVSGINRGQFQSTDILAKTRSQFRNEYEYLKYKKWHNNFNIISNKACI